MTADEPGGTLKPVAPARVAREIAELSTERRNGTISADDYDQRFARMIQELRARRIEGNRADINAALKPLIDNGTITQGEFDRLTKQLGLQ